MADDSFESYLDELVDLPSQPPLTPEIDSFKSSAPGRPVHAGLVQKAIFTEGEGPDGPEDRSLVFVRLALVDSDDTELVIASHAGPFAFVLDAGSDAEDPDLGPMPEDIRANTAPLPPRGLTLALPTMRRGEVAFLRLQPPFSITPDSLLPFALPPSVDLARPLTLRAELLGWEPAGTYAAVHPEEGAVRTRGLAFRKVLRQGESWEQAQAPSSVRVHMSLREARGGGGFSGGERLWGTGGEGAGEPVRLALGDPSLPLAVAALAEALHEGEEAALLCPRGWVEEGEGAGAPSAAHPALRGLRDTVARADPSILHLVLVMDLVEIHQVRDIRGDGSVLKQRLARGQGEFPMDCPLHDCPVTLACRTWTAPQDPASSPGDGYPRAAAGPWTLALPAHIVPTAVHEPDAPLSFFLGDTTVSEELDAAIRMLVRGEAALVRCRDPSSPASFTFHEVRLLAFDRPPMTEDASVADHLAYAEQLKEVGNRLYRAGKWDAARSKYLLVSPHAHARA